MVNKTKHKTPALDPNMTQADAERMLADLGCLQRGIEAVDATRDNSITVMKKRAAETKEPMLAEIKSLVKKLASYAEKNRDNLCEGKSKTAYLATGEFVWRKGPMKVTIKGVEAVLERLIKARLKKFIRTKQEIDKEAMLKDVARAKKIEGVTISQDETLEIKPYETRKEEKAAE